MIDFGQVIEPFLSNEFEEAPVTASALGLTDFDDRLDDLSADGFERRATLVRTWRERFDALPNESLTEDEVIDRDLAVAMPQSPASGGHDLEAEPGPQTA